MRRREPHGRVFVGAEHGELDHVPNSRALRRVHEIPLPLDSVWAGGCQEKRLLGALERLIERLGVGEVRNYGLDALPLHGARFLGAVHHRAHRCPSADQFLDHQASVGSRRTRHYDHSANLRLDLHHFNRTCHAPRCGPRIRAAVEVFGLTRGMRAVKMRTGEVLPAVGKGNSVDIKAAVAFGAEEPLKVETVQLEGPKAGEVLVEVKSTGVCHTDEYTRSGADPEGLFPSVLGHEGAGVVVEVGEGVTSVAAGDHVIPLYTPGVPAVRVLPQPEDEPVRGDPVHPGPGPDARRDDAALDRR